MISFQGIKYCTIVPFGAAKVLFRTSLLSYSDLLFVHIHITLRKLG